MERHAHAIKFYGRRKGKAIKQNRQAAYNLVMPWAEIKLEGIGTNPDAHPGEGCEAPSRASHGLAAPRLRRMSHIPPAGGNVPDPGLRRGGAVGESIDPKTFFDFPVKEIWLEIGFGNGEHLAHLAEQNPEVGMIGCEPFLNGMAAMCRDIKDKKLKNVRLWQDDARLLLPRLKSHSLSHCLLLNSDPWPKKRHHKRRFVQKETLDELHRLLKKGAEFRMSTDDPGLAAWELEKTYFHGGFKWLAESCTDWRQRPEDMMETRYQKKGAAQGRPTVFLRFEVV